MQRDWVSKNAEALEVLPWYISLTSFQLQILKALPQTRLGRTEVLDIFRASELLVRELASESF